MSGVDCMMIVLLLVFIDVNKENKWLDSLATASYEIEDILICCYFCI